MKSYVETLRGPKAHISLNTQRLPTQASLRANESVSTVAVWLSERARHGVEQEHVKSGNGKVGGAGHARTRSRGVRGEPKPDPHPKASDHQKRFSLFPDQLGSTTNLPPPVPSPRSILSEPPRKASTKHTSFCLSSARMSLCSPEQLSHAQELLGRDVSGSKRRRHAPRRDVTPCWLPVSSRRWKTKLTLRRRERRRKNTFPQR
ncbi:hypothetical protein AAFF_G00432430 [Aldrovandia affinis]|uniref:Uncharacterized protein n=1 Tax=Aldrovandia affinis TaxID=143900 RepID=A0AAD7SAR9_9TELE|nr:hypothetical protein AAFF_G00432430 [Aldrovandia affinis]